MKKPIFIIVLLSLVVMGLLITRITLVNSISTTGIKLVDLQNEISAYKKQNEILKVQYLQAASYTNISSEAKKLGYVTVKSQVDLASPMPMAMR